MNQALTQQRIRVRIGKQGMFRFVGHLDLARIFEHVLRRGEISLEYTQGFNPRPRIQFAAALPVGVTSTCEYVDAWLINRLVDGFPERWIERLNATSTSGLVVYDITEVPVKSDALPTLVTSAEYIITPADDAVDFDALCQRAQALIDAPTIERVRRGKPYDLRPLILALTPGTDAHLIAHMVAGDRGNGRPDELVDALGLDITQAHIHRRCLYLGDEPSPST
ncbi:MAG: DUF2344 domain-containing protein [Anaerolineae bacterium]|nr:DUF2344 domain-containing protein [Anaerolineae bacterium]